MQKMISVALTGSGGSGVITAGNMILQAAARAGFFGQFGRSSGPQIRGGEAAAMLHLSNHPVDAPGDVFKILVALDWHNTDRFAVELPLSIDSLIIADPDQGDIPDVLLESGAKVVEIPLKKLSKQVAKGRPNMVAVGLISGILGLGEDVVDQAMVKALSKRGEDALTSSRGAAALGRDAANEIEFQASLGDAPQQTNARWLLNGNEATGFGALLGGIRFVAAYPITPATEVLEWMSPNLKKLGGALVQAEDELASINMIIGASYGGTPSLTATSGPGLALMLESLGLAIASEIPVVIVDVMRGGPSTGIPTKSEQSDLNIALFGPHGDAPHLVLAPSGIQDCVKTTAWAVQLAEATQTPTVVLSDQLLGQTRAVVERPDTLPAGSMRKTSAASDEGYQRYLVDNSGISAMAVPGTAGCQYTADGLEHDPVGVPSSQVADHRAQLDKRAGKIENYDFGDDWADIEGDGDLAVIAWGSTAGVVREAIRRLDKGGLNLRLIVPRLLAPAQPSRMAEALKGCDRALSIELSHGAQFYHYLKGYYDIACPLTQYHRPGPLPFRPGELVQEIENWSRS